MIRIVRGILRNLISVVRFCVVVVGDVGNVSAKICQSDVIREDRWLNVGIVVSVRVTFELDFMVAIGIKYRVLRPVY